MKKFCFAVLALSTAAFAKAEFTYTVDPAPGEVTELTSILLKGDPSYDELESVSMSDASVTKDGVFFCGLNCKCSTTAPNATLTLKKDATEPGTYVVTVPESGLAYYYNDYSGYGENEKEIVLTYVIKKVVTDTGLDFTTVPAEGSQVEDLSTITLNVNPEVYSAIARTTTDVLFNVLKDGEIFTTATCAGSGLSWVFTLDQAPEEAGEYTLEIPGGSFSATKIGESSSYNVTDSYSVKFKFVPAAKPVVYDLEVYGTKPVAGAEIDLSMSDLEIFIYSAEPTFTPDPNTDWAKPAHDAKVKLVSADGKWEEEVELKYSHSYQMWVKFSDPMYDGEYTMIIPQGSFGDSAWQKDAALGHANKEFTCKFTLTGLGIEGGVEYTLEPLEITPTGNEVNDLSVVTVKFPEGTKMKEGTKATLSSTVVRYEVTVDVEEIGDGEFRCTFDPAPTEAQTYTLIIERGAFGDEIYMADNAYGLASASVGKAWEFVPKDDAVNEIAIDDYETVIYNLTGSHVNANNLPAGIYIINGRKTVIR